MPVIIGKSISLVWYQSLENRKYDDKPFVFVYLSLGTSEQKTLPTCIDYVVFVIISKIVSQLLVLKYDVFIGAI